MKLNFDSFFTGALGSVVIVVYLELTADLPQDLRSVVSEFIGVNQSSVEMLELGYSEGTLRRRHLLSYTWLASFQVIVVEELTGYESGEELALFIQSVLSTEAFSDALIGRGVDATVTKVVSSFEAGKVPTTAPSGGKENSYSHPNVWQFLLW